MRRLSRGVAGGGAAVLVAAALTACSSPTTQATDCSTYQDPFQHGEKHEQFPLDVVLLDLHDNSAQEAERVGRALTPYLHQALQTGAYVSVVADGGQGTQLRTSACFDGTDAAAPFLIKSGSSSHDADDQGAGTGELAAKVREFARNIQVAPQGSATRLLAGTERIAADARSTGRVSDVAVIAYTDMLGNNGPADCLTVDRATAAASTAEALAERCMQSGQLTPLNVHSLRFVGVGVSAVSTEQALLASSLTSQLCPRLTPNCQQGAVTP